MDKLPITNLSVVSDNGYSNLWSKNIRKPRLIDSTQFAKKMCSCMM